MISIAKVLESLKIAALNEMQNAAIEAAKDNKNLLLLSPTGSGKTLAFLLPILQELRSDLPGIQAMVIVPSRELALQIEQVFRQMATSYKVTCCYGGHAMQIEMNNLEQPPALIIGTPGRLADHLRRSTIDPETIRTLVLDEFDKSLELGFKEDMAFIIENLSNLKKRILTSATQGVDIPSFTGLVKPVVLNYLTDTPPPTLTLRAVRSEGTDKLEALFKLSCKIGNKPTLIFCNHREAVERISERLQAQGLEHGIFHGGLEQDARLRALIKFRNGSHHMLITTDLASRGLDIPEIECVIHYQLPDQENAFIHRNGRTARMHAEGTAYLILSEEEILPPYLHEHPDYEDLPEKDILPELSPWTTLYISAGKKDKISKTDIVGFLLQKASLQKEDVGKIEVLDHSSYAAVKKYKVKKILQLTRNEKIKKQQVKIDVAW